MSSTLRISVASIKLADAVRDELETHISAMVSDGNRGTYLDVKIDSYNTGNRVAIILEAVLSDSEVAPADTMRFKLKT